MGSVGVGSGWTVGVGVGSGWTIGVGIGLTGGVKRTGSPTGKGLITGSGMPRSVVGTGGTNSSRGSLILLINSCSGLGGIAGGKISLGKSISTTFLGGTCIGGCTGGCNGNTGGNIGNGIGRLGAGGVIGKGLRRIGVGVDMIVSIGSLSNLGRTRSIALLKNPIMTP